MENNRIVSAICYFSVFFAPFLLPIVVWIISNDPDVRSHAKGALLSHCIPVLGLIWIISVFVRHPSGIGSMLAGIIFFGFASLLVTIWNVVRGILILVRD